MPLFILYLVALAVIVVYVAMVQFMVLGWRRQRANTFGECPITIPMVSVVVAFRNEEHNLPVLIKAIAAQTLPYERFELILVDDGSSDHWQSAIPGIEGLAINIIPNKGEGKKQAIRTGVEAAKGMVVLVTDADCRPGTKWIETMSGYFTDSAPRLVIGPVMLLKANGFFQQFQRADFLSLQLSGAGAAHNGRPIMCNGANMAFTRNFYLSVPHLNPRFLSGDDMFLLHRAKQLHVPIVFAKSAQAIVETPPEANFKQMWRQRIRWASKTTGYTDADTLWAAYIVATANVMLASLWTISLFAPNIWLLAFTAYIVKCITDQQLFLYGTSFFGIKTPVWQYAIIQFIHPFYTTATVLASLTANVNWKGRKVISPLQ